MAQVKIYALRAAMEPLQSQFSRVVHECLVAALQIPPEKRFQRFLLLEADEFLFPLDRSERYTILEISLFSGRSSQTKKTLIRLLYERLGQELNWAPGDLEILLLESPRENWGIRGMTGDELGLNYRVEV